MLTLMPVCQNFDTRIKKSDAAQCSVLSSVNPDMKYRCSPVQMCDRVRVRCGGLITNSETFLCQAVSSTRGEHTLRREYLLRPAAASLHLGLYASTISLSLWMALHIHIHYYDAFYGLVLWTIDLSKYKLIPQGDPWKRSSMRSRQEPTMHLLSPQLSPHSLHQPMWKPLFLTRINFDARQNPVWPPL